MKKITSLLLIIGLLNACSNPENPIENPTNTIKLSSEIEWEKLNPAREDKSPQAGTIWGDRKGKVATGFLAKFVDGFSSPPHIHNVTYRAVVIKGLIHNDDQNADNMWMQPGSFWTQPKGQSHITSAKGSENIAYVEIDQGPYLVKSIQESFQTQEQPINIDASNVYWLDNKSTNWIDSKCLAEISFLWNSQDNKNMKGLFIKLPSNFKGRIESNGDVFHAVVIQGNLEYKLPQTQKIQELDPGSYFNSTNHAIHTITNTSVQETIVYIRTNGGVKIK